MFALFKKHRILKLVGIAFGLFLLWFLLSPMVDMIKGQDLTNEQIIGSYIYGSSHYVELYTVRIGKMVSEEVTIEFTYTYDKGVLECQGYDEETTWKMRAISDNAIFNGYDSTYLFKRNVR